MPSKVQKALDVLRELPHGLTVMLVVYGALPVLSFAMLPIIERDWQAGHVWGLGFYGLIFWILPILMIWSLLRRSPLVVAFFVASCITNIAYSYAYLPMASDASYEVLRWVFIMIVLVGGAVILRLDHLIPFLTGRERYWRKSVRVRTERLVTLVGLGKENSSVVLKNVSKTGFCIAGFSESMQIDPSLNELPLSLAIADHTFTISSQVVWQSTKHDQAILGLHALDQKAMALLFEFCSARQAAHGTVDMILRSYLTSGVRRAFVSLWGLASTLSVIIPSCGRTMDTEQPLGPHTTELVVTTTGLSLIGATSSTIISINGCISGYQTTFNVDQSPTVQLTMGDTNCLAYLDQFSLDSETFSVAPGHTFNPTEGTTTPFQSPSGRLVYAHVTTQLPNEVMDSPQISFTLVESAKGADVVFTGVSLPEVSIAVDHPQVTEGSGPQVLTFTITRTGAMDNDLLVNLVQVGTATAPEDFQSLPSSIYIPLGDAQVRVTTTLVDDQDSEVSEALSLGIDAGPAYIPHPSPAVVAIEDDDYTGLPPGFVFHLQGDQIQAGNGFVNLWPDLSSNSHDASQSNSSLQPALGADFLTYQSAIFDGIDDVLVLSNTADINTSSEVEEKTIAMALKTGADVTSQQVLWEQGNNSKGLVLFIEQSMLYLHVYHNNTFSEYVGTAIASDTFYNVRAVYSVTSSKLQLYLGDKLMANLAVATSLRKHGAGIGLGGVNGNTKHWNGNEIASPATFGGEIAEMVYYNGPLSETVSSDISAYFVTKYIQPNTHILSVATSHNQIAENAGIATLTFSRPVAASAEPASFPLHISGTAIAGEDYVTLPTSVDFAAQETVKIFSLEAINDSIIEGSETVIVDISNIDGYVASPSNLSVEISDDDHYSPPADGLVMNFNSNAGVTLSGGQVSAWANQVADSVDFTQSGSRKWPSFIADVGLLSAIKFDGNNDVLTAANHPTINNGTFDQKTLIFAFETPADVTPQQSIYSQGNNTRGMNVYIGNGNINFGSWNTKNDDDGQTTPWSPVFLSAAIQPLTKYYIILEFDQPLGELRLSVNGGTPTSVPGVGKLFSHNLISLGSGTRKTLFESGSADQNFGGSIYQFLHYNRLLTSEERQDLESYYDQILSP